VLLSPSSLRRRILTVLLLLCISAASLRAQSTSEEPSKYSFDYSKVVPGMPENASLGAYGGVTVSTAKGLPGISFNLYTVSKGGVSIPISIAYQASGIKYNDVPSAVGLKWSLDAGGSINRSVNGIVDEDFLMDNLQVMSDAFMDYQNAHINSHPVQDSCLKMAKGNYDCSLDNYYYSFPGHSGSMYLGPGKKFRPDKEYTRLQVSYGNHLDSFIIKDDKGNTYIFGSYADNSIVYSGLKYNKQAKSSFSARVAWKLRKIITATQQQISFEYTPHYYEYTTLDAERWTQYIWFPGALFERCTDENYNYLVGTNEDAYTTTRFVNTAFLLSKISTDDQEVLLNYTDNSALPIFKKKLASIKVYSKITLDTLKKWTFTHDGDYLAGFAELDRYTNTPAKTWSFQYNNTSPLTPSSKSRDMFGYYNGVSNGNLLANPYANAFHYYPFLPADRHVNEYAIHYGMLNEITYPTGGKTFFEYEPNREIVGGDTLHAPGVRIKTVYDQDENNKVYNKKKFHYRGLQHGKLYNEMTQVNEPLSALEPTMVVVLHSEPISNTGADAFYYEKVITENTGNGSGTEKQYQADHYVPQFELYESTSPVLVKQELYLGDTLHLQQSTLYNYEMLLVDSIKIRTYTLRKAIPYQGRYYYEDDPGLYPFCIPVTIYQGYDLQETLFPILYNLKTITTKEYTPLGDSIIKTTANTYYANPVYLQQSDKTILNDKTESVAFTYPFNYGSGALLDMKNSFIYGPVVKEQYLVNTVALREKVNSYAWNSNGFFVQDQQTLTDITAGTSQVLRYYDYNAKGRLLSQGRDNDVRTSYVWDYLEDLPIAEVSNASPASIAYTSFETSGLGGWTIFSGAATGANEGITGSRSFGGTLRKQGLATANYTVTLWSLNTSVTVNGQAGTQVTTRGSWRLYEWKLSNASSVEIIATAIDEVRLYPQGALMTSYTYQPLTGISSQCDANNRITYYEYDGLGRLKMVRDDNKNILKALDYQYLQNYNQ
jgi:hypothetical protein